MKNASRTGLQFLSQIDFQEKNNVMDACKEINDILNYYLSNKLAYLSQQEKTFIKNNNKMIWVDYLIYRYKFKNYGRLRKIPEFPLYLLIEPTSICNLRCKMCFQTDESFSSNKNFMGRMDLSFLLK